MAVLIRGRNFNVNNGKITPPYQEPPEEPGVVLLHPPDVTYTNVTPASIAKPAYLTPVEETSYAVLPNGYKRFITRITDAGVFGMSNPTHHYSKTQPWNCDGTKMLIETYILDGKTFSRLEPLGISADGINPQWSNTDPNILYIFDNRIVRRFNVVTKQNTVIRNFASEGYTYQELGPNEGNLSNDDKYACLVSTKSGTQVIEVFDMTTATIVSSKPRADFLSVAGEALDFATMTPSGNYVMVRSSSQATGSLVIYHRLYDRDLNFIRTLQGGSHPDFGFTNGTTGTEIMLSVDPISITPLATGVRQVLLSNTLVDSYNGNKGGHANMKAKDMPGWGFISFSNGKCELIAVKLDGSGIVKRYGFVRDLTSDSNAETAGCPSRDGTRFCGKGRWNETTGEINSYVFEVKKV